MKNINKDLKLLPYPFKKVVYGVFVLILLFVILSITKVLSIDKEVIKVILKNILLIAFLVLALTEDKDEDEMISKIRLKAFAASFIYGVVTLIINPLVNLAFDGKFYTDKKAGELLISMFLFYFLIFYFMKRKR